MQTAAKFNAIIAATSGVTGRAFFRALARVVAEVLDCSHALVGRADGTHVDALGMWTVDHYVDGFRYALDGTPCSNVYTGEVCQYTEQLQQRFPRDRMLVDEGIEAYFGIPIHSPRREGCVGVLVALDRKPRQAIPELETLLSACADRVGAEFDRLEVEEALRQSEARYRQIVTTCLEGVWTIDAEANTTYVNPQMAGMLGYEPAEIVGRPVEAFTDEEGREALERNLARRRQGIQERHEFPLLRKDGTRIWVLMSTAPLTGPDGAYQGALAMVTDVTEQRAYEQAVRHASKMESLGRLAGHVAHDFNNLLGGVMACVDLLKLDPSDNTRIFGDIEAAIRHGRELTSQVLTFAGQDKVDLRRVDLNTTVRRAVRFLRIGLVEGVELELDLAPEPMSVRADPNQLHQVLMNLVHNAGRAVGAGPGTIRLHTRRIEVDGTTPTPKLIQGDLHPPSTYFALDVSDDGVGMSVETRERMFDPFFTTHAAGQGLGLAVVSGIVRAHCGGLSVSSEPGRGTTVTVFLPQDPVDKPPSKETPRPTVGRLWRGIALLAEDDPILRRTSGRLLQHLGFEVLVAADGQEALERAIEHAADLALMVLDHRMPRLTGLAVLHEVRRQGLTVPAVLYTGMMPDLEGEVVDGALLAKPFSLEELRAAVASVVPDEVGG